MERKIEKIEEKLDVIAKDISEINQTLSVNTTLLDEHIRRTNLLEERLEPIERHVISIQGAVKIASVSLGLIGSALAIARYLGMI